MIALDSSALMAIVLNEAAAPDCIAVLETEPHLVLSAATLAEVLIVAGSRGLAEQMGRLIDNLAPEIAPVTQAAAMRVAQIYRQWGRGHHPAGLNFGDCFSYDLAREHGCPLLFVGGDFRQTDIRPALGG